MRGYCLRPMLTFFTCIFLATGAVAAFSSNASALSASYCTALSKAVNTSQGVLQGERGVSAVRIAIAWDIKTYSGLARLSPTKSDAEDFRKVVAAYKKLDASTSALKWIVSHFNGPIPAAYNNFVLVDEIYNKSANLLDTCPQQ